MKTLRTFLPLAALAAALLAPPTTAAPAKPTPDTPGSGASRAAGAPHTPSAPAVAARPDSGMTLRGDQEGTVFRSLTIEGEDRIHIEFERPALKLDLDPTQAPGLEIGGARDILDRTVPDLTAPLLTLSASETSPYVGRPWLNEFASGAVARFRPAVRDVERWRLLVADAHGQSVMTFQGRGQPPAEIAWDGRSSTGKTVTPGLTYSYVLEAYDRAGNKRNFVGEGFQVNAYRVQTPEGIELVLSARDLVSDVDPRRAGPAATPLALLEAASWLNQSVKPKQVLRVTATGRSLEGANALAASVVRQITPLLLGDPARVQTVVLVEPDAPEGGTLRIATAK